MRKLKAREVAGVRNELLSDQDNMCAICTIKLIPEQAVLDHDHTTGAVRGVLCRNCNGIEGKVHNLARRAKRKFTPAWWLLRLLDYWSKHSTDQTGLMHPTHKTAEEKRLLKNARARKARTAAKT